jgi:hypothetical protein
MGVKGSTEYCVYGDGGRDGGGEEVCVVTVVCGVEEDVWANWERMRGCRQLLGWVRPSLGAWVLWVLGYWAGLVPFFWRTNERRRSVRSWLGRERGAPERDGQPELLQRKKKDD